KMWLAVFSRAIQELHRNASLVLEDAVRDTHTVVAFCALNKVMELYELPLTESLEVIDRVPKIDPDDSSALEPLRSMELCDNISYREFYDPVAGQLLLDGKDLKQFNLRWLRNHLGLVEQEPVIFSTTIRENIFMQDIKSEVEMKEAARIANAHQFNSSLPHGYDTHVG
ncbi:hypothetical protein RJ640_015547, partial [Escallonia rubra]